MAKNTAAAEEAAVASEAAPTTSAPEVALIIEKYLATRDDIDPALKRVCCIIYKGETHVTSEWADIINRRLTRPAD